MLRRLRAPWLALLLLVLSPPVGGQLLPLLHPCEAQAAGHVHGAAPDHAAHGAPAGHDQPHGESACTCIGACQAPAVLGSPTTAVASIVPVGVVDTPSAVSPLTAVTLASRPLDRLPPTTAPPLA